MAIFQDKSKRKKSGGRYKSNTYYKRNAQTGRLSSRTIIDDKKAKTIRTIGGNKKMKLLSINKANILDPKTKKGVVVSFKNTTENTANRHFIRRNILTKGAVIETSKGKAKITNRPSQEGFINAVLI